MGNKDSRASLGDPPTGRSMRSRSCSGKSKNMTAPPPQTRTKPPTWRSIRRNMPWALTAPFVGDDSARGFYYGDWMCWCGQSGSGGHRDAIDNHASVRTPWSS
ncbi:MAG: hypothetical protein R3F11_20275 [Verrucomicrobiales bacterium]